jgi:hypothetical protein
MSLSQEAVAPLQILAQGKEDDGGRRDILTGHILPSFLLVLSSQVQKRNLMASETYSTVLFHSFSAPSRSQNKKRHD